MDFAINAPDIVDGLNATEKIVLREQMEIIGKFASNDIPNIGVLPSASKDVSIKFLDLCIHIPNDKHS